MHVTRVYFYYVPPGNHLERLRGDREGQYSIKINDQYRICFCADGNRFSELEIVDYH
ncbi:MAG: type II toxin-antitoxin system RelE/ParE family toxin [Lachnospiraceae bacterium]|nr:type II toxin-antitoxin system RelE/ParE family toxin [Lachnospiraceae bacterium]